jgi:hypothetical protein
MLRRMNDQQGRDGVTPLERRCRLLLLAYPGAYRRVRAEEMLDTLLETSPAGRCWPLPRDCWAMIVGGLQVRAAQNRRLSTAANLRLAALLGCFLYVCYEFTSDAASLWFMGPGMWRQYGSLLLAPALRLLACTVMFGVRPGGRKGAIATIVAVAALIAGTVAAVVSDPAAGNVAEELGVLIVLAALALLSHGDRLPRVWLWPAGALVSVPLLGLLVISPGFGHDFAPWLPSMNLHMWEAVVFLAFAWIVVDARPAVGVAIFLGLAASARLIGIWLEVSSLRSRMMPAQSAVLGHALLGVAWSFAWPLLAAAFVLVALSAWRLRRQVML